LERIGLQGRMKRSDADTLLQDGLNRFEGDAIARRAGSWDLNRNDVFHAEVAARTHRC
jgi:hypothetical protein